MGRGASWETYEAKVTSAGSPTIRRRELGALLRKLRADLGLTAEEVTARLLFSPTKLSRIETGQSGASARDIRDLCDLYGVTDPAEREHLMVLAREGKQRGWWQDYDLPYATYVGLEAVAVSINDYQSGTVPGLIQTEDYIRAMLLAEVPPFSAQKLDQLLQARLTRQAVLGPGSTLRYHAILDEAVLHRQVGGTASCAPSWNRSRRRPSKRTLPFRSYPLRPERIQRWKAFFPSLNSMSL